MGGDLCGSSCPKRIVRPEPPDCCTVHCTVYSADVSQTSPRRLGDVGETSGRRLGVVWEWFGRRLGVVWESSGSRLGDVWESSGSRLGDIWETATGLVGFGEIHLRIGEIW